MAKGKVFFIGLLNICFLSLFSFQNSADAQSQQETNKTSRVNFVKKGDRILVNIGDHPFTELRTKNLRKPILYPVFGPGQVPMTRNYPMVKGTPNESTDHPHHQSIWFTHGKVNGEDFWISSKMRKGTGAKIETTKTEIVRNSIKTDSVWKRKDGQVVCNDRRVMTFGETADGNRFIDYEVDLMATKGNVVFGDTKEGTMAVRIHPMLRLKADKKRGTTTVNGKAMNSEGVTGRGIWGKRAKWVAYWGNIDKKPVGIAIFDHSKNLRHPTWWHARHYGLVAANPFGIHDFERKPKGTGDYVIKKDNALKLKYRILFFKGEASKKKMDAAFLQYLKGE